MSSRITISVEGNQLNLCGVLDDKSVLEVDAQGKEWLKNLAATDASLDLSQITYSSSAGIALLLGWLRFADEQQKTLRILQIPAKMLALAKVSGLDDLFE